MVYKNPYLGYSDTEYGYHDEQVHGTEQVYGYQGDHVLHHGQADGGHYGHEEGYGAQVIVTLDRLQYIAVIWHGVSMA